MDPLAVFTLASVNTRDISCSNIIHGFVCGSCSRKSAGEFLAAKNPASLNRPSGCQSQSPTICSLPGSHKHHWTDQGYNRTLDQGTGFKKQCIYFPEQWVANPEPKGWQYSIEVQCNCNCSCTTSGRRSDWLEYSSKFQNRSSAARTIKDSELFLPSFSFIRTMTSGGSPA